MTLGEYFYKADLGNRKVHLKGKRGCWYQDHMLDLIVAYKDEVVNEDLTIEDETDVYIELYPRTRKEKYGYAV